MVKHKLEVIVYKSEGENYRFLLNIVHSFQFDDKSMFLVLLGPCYPCFVSTDVQSKIVYVTAYKNLGS